MRQCFTTSLVTDLSAHSLFALSVNAVNAIISEHGDNTQTAKPATPVQSYDVTTVLVK
jgi:uncharacterized Rossmann fold enzyme